MKIKTLADVTYDMLQSKYKAISSTKINSRRGQLNIVQITPAMNSSRVTSDLYIFDNGQLRFRDITLKNQDETIRKIETDIVAPNEIITVVKNEKEQLIETFHKKLIMTIKEVRKNQVDGPIMQLWYKFIDRKVNKQIPVIVTETIKKEAGAEIDSFYKILVKGDKNKLLIKGSPDKGIAQLKDKKNNIIEELVLTNESAIDDITVLNKLFNYFFKKNKGFQ